MGATAPFFLFIHGKLTSFPYSIAIGWPELLEKRSEFLEDIQIPSVIPFMNKLIATVVAAVVLSFSLVASADETNSKMDWNLKNRSKMDCKLVGGMTLTLKGDFVETKHLVCKSHGNEVITATVACGPEGSVTRFDGHKIKVTCAAHTYAQK